MPTTTTAAAPAAAARGCSVRDANPLDRAVTGDTFGGVRTISLKQLHAETDRWVRAAKSGPVRATDRGEVAAVLVTESAANSARPIFPGARFVADATGARGLDHLCFGRARRPVIHLDTSTSFSPP